MSRRLPTITPREAIRALKRAGFVVHRTTGSHYILKHAQNPRVRVTVAYHPKDLKRSALRSIIRQTRLTVEEFLDLL